MVIRTDINGNPLPERTGSIKTTSKGLPLGGPAQEAEQRQRSGQTAGPPDTPLPWYRRAWAEMGMPQSIAEFESNLAHATNALTRHPLQTLWEGATAASQILDAPINEGLEQFHKATEADNPLDYLRHSAGAMVPYLGPPVAEGDFGTALGRGINVATGVKTGKAFNSVGNTAFELPTTMRAKVPVTQPGAGPGIVQEIAQAGLSRVPRVLRPVANKVLEKTGLVGRTTQEPILPPTAGAPDVTPRPTPAAPVSDWPFSRAVPLEPIPPPSAPPTSAPLLGADEAAALSRWIETVNAEGFPVKPLPDVQPPPTSAFSFDSPSVTLPPSTRTGTGSLPVNSPDTVLLARQKAGLTNQWAGEGVPPANPNKMWPGEAFFGDAPVPQPFVEANMKGQPKGIMPRSGEVPPAKPPKGGFVENDPGLVKDSRFEGRNPMEEAPVKGKGKKGGGGGGDDGPLTSEEAAELMGEISNSDLPQASKVRAMSKVAKRVKSTAVGLEDVQSAPDGVTLRPGTKGKKPPRKK